MDVNNLLYKYSFNKFVMISDLVYYLSNRDESKFILSYEIKI